MKKLNLNNQISDDDEILIRLLKTSIGQEPSEQFVENTLEKVMIHKTKQRIAHKPLKSPLYLMLIIGLILLTPVFITSSSQVSLPESRSEFGNLLQNISFQLDSWYALTPMVLVLVLILAVWIELGLAKFRNPFV